MTAHAGQIFTVVDMFDHDKEEALRRHFVLIAVLCHDANGALAAGGDALDVRWFELAELNATALATSFSVADVARLAT